VDDCNCSICSKSGYLHLTVPKSRFRLLSGSDALVTCQFNTGTVEGMVVTPCNGREWEQQFPSGRGAPLEP
jgi:hypothetical protein